MAKNIERSREVRQWVKLGVEIVSLGAMLDCTVNNGQGIKTAHTWFKDKWSALKRKFSK